MIERGEVSLDIGKTRIAALRRRVGTSSGSHQHRNNVLGALLTAWCFLFGSALESQPADLRPNEWTPLTDEITIGQLKTQLSNLEEHKRRYDVAVSEGKIGEYPGRRKLIKHFIDPSENPELIPMWDAYMTFCVMFEAFGFEQYETDVRRDLVARGMTAESADFVILSCRKGTAELEVLRNNEGAVLSEVSDRINAMRSDSPASIVDQLAADVDRAVAHRDSEQIAVLLGISQEKANKFLEVSQRRWTLEIGVQLLEHTWEELSSEDWEQLRQYLLWYVRTQSGIEMEVNL